MATETTPGSAEPPPAWQSNMVCVAAMLASLVLVGCHSASQAPEPAVPVVLRVAAASDLQRILPALADRFTAVTGVAIDPVVGASGQLAQQIRQGAPYDVFLSANLDYVRDLAAAGLIHPDSVREYARGRLVLVVSKHATVPIQSLADLESPEIKHIAIANPEIAPYGLAARQALENSGLWESLKPKVVQAESVRQALQFVQSGNADVGLVAHSVTRNPEDQPVDVDPNLYQPILQGLGIITRTQREIAARQFTEFLIGDEARSLLTAHGFGLPQGDADIQ